VFELLLGSADIAVERFVFSVWQGFTEAATPLVTALLVISVVLFGYLVWQGRVQISRNEIGTRAAQLAIIFVFVTKVDVLDRFVYRIATDVPGAVASRMVLATGVSDTTINRSLDEIFLSGIKTGGRILEEASVYDLGTVLFGFILIGVTMIALIPVGLVLVLSKLAVGVLLGLAPFALLLYLLPATRGLFEGYLRQLLGFALIPVMIYALLGLLLSLVRDVSAAVVQDSLEGVPGLAVVGPYIVVMVLVGLLSTQVLGWSSGIAGGLSLSAQGLFSRPASLGRGSLEALQAGRRAVAATREETRLGRAAAFTGGALRQGLGLRPPRGADPLFRGSER
jgi:type IV secretion system protein VirB6